MGFLCFNGYANGFGQNGLIEVDGDLEDAMHERLVAKLIEFCFGSKVFFGFKVPCNQSSTFLSSETFFHILLKSCITLTDS